MSVSYLVPLPADNLKKYIQETYSEEYHLVNSIFELIDKTKLITVIFRLYFKVIEV